MTVRVAVGLGSNLGDRASHLGAALEAIRSDIGEVVAVSAMYETAPVGGPEQGDYLNAVVVVDTALTPPRVLEQLLAIERRLGRERRERWGPRTIDLDLLVYGDDVVDEPGLTVPHPELANRRFVLEPLAEAWPDLVLPDGTGVTDLLDGVADQEVRRWKGRGEVPAVAVFLTVGLGAAVVWWLIDYLLR